MREVIHQLKFDGREYLASFLGQFLAYAIVRLVESAPRELLVVPVPLHKNRLRSRGFNQSRLIAKHAIKILKKIDPTIQLQMAPHTLIRHRETASQFDLSPRQRRLNLKGAFVVGNQKMLEGRDILLIDDIFTTGATARSAAAVLINGGARSVYVATLARALLKQSNDVGETGYKPANRTNKTSMPYPNSTPEKEYADVSR